MLTLPIPLDLIFYSSTDQSLLWCTTSLCSNLTALDPVATPTIRLSAHYGRAAFTDRLLLDLFEPNVGPDVRAIEPHVRAREPHARAIEPHVRVIEPHVRAREPHVQEGAIQTN
jgi:hypothetical protein